MAVGITGNIQVVLGSAWSGYKTMAPDTVITLQRVGATSAWSESGSNIGSSSNRLRMFFTGQSINKYYNGMCGSTGPPTYMPLPSYRCTFANYVSVADFGFESLGTKKARRNFCTPNTNYDTVGMAWNAKVGTYWTYTLDFFSNYPFFHNTFATSSNIFTSIALVTADTVSVQDGDDVITDGATIPINFGSTPASGLGKTKTFTLINLDEENTLTVSDITVPTGYTLVENVSSPIAADSSDTFTIRLDSTHVGTKYGEVAITTDGTPSTYNFTITGVVSDAESSASAGPSVDGILGNVFGSMIWGD